MAENLKTPRDYGHPITVTFVPSVMVLCRLPLGKSVMSGSTPTLLPLCTGCLKPWTSSRYRTCDACRDRACAHRQARLQSRLPVRYDYPYWSIFSDFSQIMIHDLTTSYDDSNRIIVLSFRPFLFNPLSIQTERRCRFCSSCHVLN